MTYFACPAHDYPRAGCADCGPFDPSRNLTFAALRDAYATRSNYDRVEPVIVTDGVDETGTVTHVRALSALEVLDVLIRDVRGEVE